MPTPGESALPPGLPSNEPTLTSRGTVPSRSRITRRASTCDTPSPPVSVHPKRAVPSPEAATAGDAALRDWSTSSGAGGRNQLPSAAMYAAHASPLAVVKPAYALPLIVIESDGSCTPASVGDVTASGGEKVPFRAGRKDANSWPPFTQVTSTRPPLDTPT